MEKIERVYTREVNDIYYNLFNYIPGSAKYKNAIDNYNTLARALNRLRKVA